VRQDASRSVPVNLVRGVPVNLVPKTVRFGPNPRIFGNCLDGCPRGGTLPCA
jgi:hypothetical protein